MELLREVSFGHPSKSRWKRSQMSSGNRASGKVGHHDEKRIAYLKELILVRTEKDWDFSLTIVSPFFCEEICCLFSSRKPRNVWCFGNYAVISFFSCFQKLLVHLLGLFCSQTFLDSCSSDFVYFMFIQGFCQRCNIYLTNLSQRILLFLFDFNVFCSLVSSPSVVSNKKHLHFSTSPST